MDELVGEFLTETNDSLSLLDQELLKLEQDPNNKDILGTIFRVMHTIKGTCGFLGLSRLESVAHASENVMGKIRDGQLAPDQAIISQILRAIDKIKEIIAGIEESGGQEPQGDDTELKATLNAIADGAGAPQAATPVVEAASPPPAPKVEEDPFGFTPVPAGQTGQVQVPAPQPAPIATPTPAPISEAAKTEAISQGIKAADAPKTATTPAAGGESAAAAQSIRINVNVLENLMDMASELVLVRNQLIQMAKNVKDTEFLGPLQKLSHLTTYLQEGVMKTRMQPVGNAWSKFPRLIRDLSLELKKKVELKMIGEDTEMDRQLIEVIKDPLTHMVRNSVDHGLEKPEDRKAAGKSETGTVTLSASQESGFIVIRIIDDGKGLPLDRIKQKIIQNELAKESELQGMSDKQIYQYIFKPGFSTAEKVTAVSGRGVGMDVVKTNIEKVGGTVELDSIVGKGSTFTIKIPLTLAILSVLILESKGQKFAIPQIRVSEIVKVQRNSKDENVRIERLNKTPVLRLRGSLMSLISLSEVLGIAEPGDDEAKKSDYVIICEVGSNSFGLIVDRVLHNEEIVVKPVSPLLKSVTVYSGTTILGDGGVIMILDINGILRRLGDVELESSDNNAIADAARKNQQNVTFIVFDAWGKAPRCVPLELVSRVEELDMAQAEWAGDERVIQYRGELMKLIMLEEGKDLPSDGIYTVIAFTDNEKIMGLVIERIVDIVEQDISSKSLNGTDGILGSLVINGKTTDVIDVGFMFQKYFIEEMRESTNQNSANKKKVLLVDDSPFFRKFMQPLLESHNFAVTTTDSAIKALEMLDSSIKYDILVSDVDMPGMSGIELVQRVKANPKTSAMPVIALTSYNSDEFISNVREMGFNGYVSKANRGVLAAKIEEIVAAHSNQKVLT